MTEKSEARSSSSACTLDGCSTSAAKSLSLKRSVLRLLYGMSNKRQVEEWGCRMSGHYESAGSYRVKAR